MQFTEEEKKQIVKRATEKLRPALHKFVGRENTPELWEEIKKELLLVIEKEYSK